MQEKISGSFLNLPEAQLIILSTQRSGMGIAARQVLLTRYLPLIVGMSRQFSGNKKTDSQILIAAKAGFIQALFKFKIDSMNNLGSYAKLYILSEIKRCLGLPLHYNKESDLTEAVDLQSSSPNNTGTEEVDYVRVAQDENPVKNLPSESISESNDRYDARIDRPYIVSQVEETLFPSLTKSQMRLISLVYFDEVSLTQAAYSMGISKQRASQIMNSVYQLGKARLANLRSYVTD